MGDDYPRVWDIALGDPVVMPFEPSRHYSLDTYDGFADWEAMVPEGGLIYLGKKRRPFSISMFHQLRCLGVVRNSIMNHSISGIERPPYQLLHHCANYLRQMVLCRADITLEQTFSAPTKIKNAQICNNWERVYEEQRLNHGGKIG